ncbi:hypothetical protein SKAU_G00097420 [Synaphobranchus kaupii]|uniref:Uncharacterized protein n=1 Tax=Synaphobranchus kaupii TaxID=118154 RepID=A0A9Q1FXK6_SYNKA|nr:hypothetical protein SKAU_G00097420 [Synaphobranchus kaupii]
MMEQIASEIPTLVTMFFSIFTPFLCTTEDISRDDGEQLNEMEDLNTCGSRQMMQVWKLKLCKMERQARPWEDKEHPRAAMAIFWYPPWPDLATEWHG